MSGGGMRFLAKYPLECGQQLDMLLEVPIFPYLDVSALASVVRVERHKKTDNTHVGVHFLDIEHIGRKRLFLKKYYSKTPFNPLIYKGFNSIAENGAALRRKSWRKPLQPKSCHYAFSRLLPSGE